VLWTGKITTPLEFDRASEGRWEVPLSFHARPPLAPSEVPEVVISSCIPAALIRLASVPQAVHHHVFSMRLFSYEQRRRDIRSATTLLTSFTSTGPRNNQNHDHAYRRQRVHARTAESCTSLAVLSHVFKRRGDWMNVHGCLSW
jgi:hypothetical protein